MTTEERVIVQVAETNPVPDSASPTAQDRAEAERVLRRVLGDAGSVPTRRRRPRLGLLAPVVSLLLVVVVAAVVLRTGGSSTTRGGADGGLQVSLVAEPTPQVPRITADAMSREVAHMRRRLASLGPGFTVRQVGANGIVVTASKARALERARVVRLVTTSAQLLFYDWEANVLTADGKTAASQLAAQNGSAISVSQGANGGAGVPGAGSMPLYDAVKLASKQTPQPLSQTQSRKGPVHYFFGTPGSAACAVAAKVTGAAPVQGKHCLLNGPDSSLDDLYSGLPAGVTRADGQLLTVPQGTVVLQAANPSASQQIGPGSPTAQFFVLRDRVALFGSEITHPTASTDQSGEPAVTFDFSGKGQSAFQRVTEQIAHRGANVSLDGTELNQHFAVALDSQLLSVPSIDFHQYPDGIIGGGGADITGGFTRRSAGDLATELRYGALPLAVRVVP